MRISILVLAYYYVHMYVCMCVGRQHARAFGLSPFFRISLTSLAITTCLRSRARLEGLPFALASTTRSPPAPPRCRRPRCCCCRRRRRVCRPLAAANRNSNNTNCARLTLFAHTSLFVCLFATVCACVCVYGVGGERALAVGCELWVVCVYLCVCGLWAVGGLGCWSVLQKFSTTRLFSIFPQRADAVCCCFFLLSSFLLAPCLLSLPLSLSPLTRALSHFCSLCLFCCTWCVRAYIQTYVHMFRRACVLEFALENLNYLFK